MKSVGLFLTLAAVLSFLIPSQTFAQGASDAQYYAAGNQYYSARNYAQAAQYYYAAVKINPNNGAAYQGLGNCYYALGRKSDALAFYQKASALQPGNTQLAQFVQNLQAQLGGGAAPGGGMTTAAPSASTYLSYGNTYLQQRQYATAIRYFQAAIQQDPNDYKGYYYAGYAYVSAGDSKTGALYFEIAAAKSGNASVKAYADRLKTSLLPADQQWVDDQASKYTGMAMGGGTTPAAGGKGGGVAFGFHILGGMEYLFSDPSQIKQYVAGAYNNAQAVSLNGVTPNMIALPELEPFIQFGQNFEINLAIGYFPVGNLSYTTFDYIHSWNPGLTSPDVWRYTFNTSIVTVDLGFKLLFGDDKVKGYLGLGAGVSPVSLSFTKIEYDSGNSTPVGVQPDSVSNGSYSAMAINAQALLGVDFVLGKGVAVGPYLGYRYLSASNFQSGGNTLSIDTTSGAVGVPGQANVSKGSSTPLTLDFSGLEGGVDLTFSF